MHQCKKNAFSISVFLDKNKFFSFLMKVGCYPSWAQIYICRRIARGQGQESPSRSFSLSVVCMALLWQYFMTCCCLTTPKLVWLTKTAVKHNENGIPSLQHSSKVMMWCVKLLLVNFVLIATVVFVKLTKLILIYPLKMSKVDCLRMLE